MPTPLEALYATHDAALAMCSSSSRVDALLHGIEDLRWEAGEDSREVARRLFAEWWSMCDDTWDHRQAILETLFDIIDDRFIEEGSEAWFATLPDLIPVYRGSSASRWNGLSWTTDRSIAVGFARGHRMIRVHEPVLVSGSIFKAGILFASNGRSESELLIDWRGVQNFQVQDALPELRKVALGAA